jgi:hypothetical protein
VLHIQLQLRAPPEMHRRFAVRPGAPDAASRAPPLPPHEPHAGQMPGQRQRPGARWAATPARRAALGAHLLLFALAPCRAAAALRSASELDREIARQFQDAFRDELGGRTTLRVGAQDKAPFVKFQGEFAGNNRFSGISIDQMKHIAFRYNFGLCVRASERACAMHAKTRAGLRPSLRPHFGRSAVCLWRAVRS